MFDDLVDKYQASQALLRTTAHPADPRVRITSNPDDLIAICCEGVRAVIWKRELPAQVREAVANMNTASFPNECNSIGVDFTGKSYRLRENKELEEHVPAVIKADMQYLSKVFLKAVNGDSGMLRESVSYQNPADPEQPCKGGARMPHIDGFEVRLNTIYSTGATMGTEWYPVTADGYLSLRAEFRSAEDPEMVKRKYGRQQISTGDVTIFKGGDGEVPADDHFPHSEPAPRQGVFRLGYLIGV
jgi:hypothetical protein